MITVTELIDALVKRHHAVQRDIQKNNETRNPDWDEETLDQHNCELNELQFEEDRITGALALIDVIEIELSSKVKS